MNRSKLPLPLFAVAIIVSLALIYAMPEAHAATKPTAGAGEGEALAIDPPIINLKANPGQIIKTNIMLRDVSGTDLIVTNQVNDFVAAGEAGTPKILLNGSGNDPYSMKYWVSPLSILTLKPSQVKTIPVVINVPESASPGSHFAVIRFTGQPPQLQGQGVSLSASIGSLVFLTVSGNIKEHLSITNFSVSKDGNTGSFFRSTPLTFSEKIKDSGNLQEQPSGEVVVTDMFGHTVAAMEVNQPPHSILPSSTRKFTEQLDKSVIGNKRFFGRYTAQLTITYGGTNPKTITAQLTFWVIPWVLILIIIAAIIIAFFIFRHLMRRYKRRILSQAQASVGQSGRRTTTKQPKPKPVTKKPSSKKIKIK